MAWTSPTTRSTGFTVTASVWNTDLIDNLVYLFSGSQGTDYTVTWTTTGTAPAISNGSIQGKWFRFGKLIFFRIVFTAGSGTTFGTGTWSFSLPVTLADTLGVSSAILRDSSTTTNKLGAGYFGSTSTVVVTYDGDTGNGITNTTPFTWAQNDTIQISGFGWAAAN